MSSRATPAVEQALAYIESLRRREAAQGGRLPTIAALAAKAGVSLRTMHQAVRILARTGLLSVRHHQGVHWADPEASVPQTSPAPAPAVRAARADRLTAEIERELLCGMLPNPLPTFKELRVRYGAGHTAVSRALSVLAGHGTIVRRGRQWVVARAEPRTGTSSIVLVGPGDTMARFANYDSKVTEFCMVLMRECALQHTSVHFQTIFRPLHPDPVHLGYLVIAGHRMEAQTNAFSALLAGRRPVVMVDILGDCAVPEIVRARGIPVVTIQGARAAARQVALLLKKLGHTRIAFLSQYTTSSTGHGWVLGRLSGLRDVYGDDVVEYSSPQLISHDATEGHFLDDVLPAISGGIDNLAALLKKHHSIVEGAWLKSLLVSPLASRLAESQLEPLLRKAAADRRLTAWVGANDETALWALRYLSGRGIAVPQRISVVGFDGSPAALLTDLASFDFNAPAAARAALDLVLRPSPIVKGQPRVLGVPGALVPRRTVAAVSSHNII